MIKFDNKSRPRSKENKSKKRNNIDSVSHCGKVSIFGVNLVHIFPYLDYIRRDTEYIFVFSPNEAKCEPE